MRHHLQHSSDEDGSFRIAGGLGGSLSVVLVCVALGLMTGSPSVQAVALPKPVVTSIVPAGGSTVGGTVVTIAGRNLTGASRVVFGGGSGTRLTVVSATQVKVTSPAHTAGAVNVQITTRGGTSAVVAGDRFTYAAPPAVTGISPSGGSTTGGTVVTVTGRNLTGASRVVFGGGSGTRLTVVSAAQVKVTSPAHTAGAVNVQITTRGGTSAVVAGDRFTYATPVKPTGPSFAAAWGDRKNGQLGDGLTSIAPEPAAVNVAAFHSAIPTHISASGADECAVAGGKAFCWGDNSDGQLGIGNTDDVHTPTAVSTAGVLSGKVVSSIDTGGNDTCAIAQGKPYCWGRGSKLGSSGLDWNADYKTPLAVDMSGALAGTVVTAISVGGDQTCVIATGKAYCWGFGLTMGRSNYSAMPINLSASGVLSGKTVTAITAGDQHSCAIADSKAYCWGEDFDGQLGDGHAGNGLPVAVNTTGELAGKTVTALSAGTEQTCAVADRRAYCWGMFGALGDGLDDYRDHFTPTAVSVAGVLAGKTVTGISAADRHTCAVAEGNAYCWGSGSLGRGKAYDYSNVPVAVGPPLSTAKVSQLTVGGGTCAVTIVGALFCWGSRAHGVLGDGTDVLAPSPVATDTRGVLAGRSVTAAAVSATHSCVIAESRAFCWGANPYGNLGNNSTVDSALPVAVDTSGALAGKTVTAISAAGAVQFENPSESHTCVVATSRAYCWGTNYLGNLGNGSTANSSKIPVAVDTSGVLAGKTVTSISVGDTHACVIAAGQPYCWGGNASGELGNGSMTRSNVPVAVSTSGVLKDRTVTAIAAGDQHTCVIADHAPYCWGNNSNGQLGNSTTISSAVPVAVVTTAALLGLAATSVTAGSNHTCAIANSNAFCWGANGSGELGDGTTLSHSFPAAVRKDGILSGTAITSISAGPYSTCEVASGRGYCWGSGYLGELGNGSTNGTSAPSPVDTNGILHGHSLTAIAVGPQHVTAIAAP